MNSYEIIKGFTKSRGIGQVVLPGDDYDNYMYEQALVSSIQSAEIAGIRDIEFFKRYRRINVARFEGLLTILNRFFWQTSEQQAEKEKEQNRPF